MTGRIPGRTGEQAEFVPHVRRVTSRHASTGLSPSANLCSLGIVATRSTTQCVMSSILRDDSRCRFRFCVVRGLAPAPQHHPRPRSPPLHPSTQAADLRGLRPLRIKGSSIEDQGTRQAPLTSNNRSYFFYGVLAQRNPSWTSRSAGKASPLRVGGSNCTGSGTEGELKLPPRTTRPEATVVSAQSVQDV